MPGQTPLEIASISEHEALDLIHRTLGHKNTTAEEASTLSNKLDRLPLALAQSLSYMKKNSIRIADYTMLLGKSDKYLVNQLSKQFEAVGRDTGTPNAVAATWVISFRQIEKNDPLAADLMSLMSWFDQQAIPDEFLTGYLNLREVPGSGLEDTSLRESLGTLIAYSFITSTTDGTYDMHRLVQLVTRKWLARNQKLHISGPQALTVLRNAFPTVNYGTLNTITRLLPHTKSVLAQTKPKESRESLEKANTTQATLKRGQLLLLMGEYFCLKTQFFDAEQHAHQGHLLLTSAVGADHEETLRAVSLLLNTKINNGRWEEVEELAQKERRRSEQKLGSEHHMTLRIILALARSYLKQNKPSEAEELLLSLLESNRRLRGNKHNFTLYCMNDLASVYFRQERLDEAKLLLLEVIDTYEELVGKEHPGTLYLLNNLAAVYRRQGQLMKAGQIFRRVADTSEKVHGLDKAHTLLYMGNLATHYRLEGNVEQAAELGGRVWRLHHDRLGENHPDTLSSMYEYVVALRKLGRKQEAVKMMRDCARLMRDGVFGPEHTRTRLSENCLRQWENEAG